MEEALAKVQPAGWTRWLFPFVQTLWDYIWSTVSSFGSLLQERCWHSGRSPVVVLQNSQGAGARGVRERLRELGLFSLRGRRLRWDLIAAYTYQMGGNREDGVRLVLRVQSGRKRVRSWKIGNSDYMGGKYSPWGQLNTGTGCLVRLWDLCPGRY